MESEIYMGYLNPVIPAIVKSNSYLYSSIY